MSCKCNWVEAVLAIIIILFTYMAKASSKWVVIIAALLLLLHALMCKKCQMCEEPKMMPKSSKKGRR
ncbi:hypothetical protein J4423_02605 [Candidatus Pacearchaeota archaeon]|nr:hypothetical protein [Candidatus Pacearchaeota archaeon]